MYVLFRPKAKVIRKLASRENNLTPCAAGQGTAASQTELHLDSKCSAVQFSAVLCSVVLCSLAN